VRSAFSVIVLALLLGGCARNKDIVDGGIYVTRTGCPQVAIPVATGDVTSFDPAGSTMASAIDVVATMTNVRSTCTQDAANLVSTVTFDVVATRRDRGPARQVVLPFFATVVQGGSAVVAKHVGAVALDFAAGSQRAATRGGATARISRSAAALPTDVQRELTRPRKAGDADAAVDPLADPKIREAVARASFEHLVGFQLSQEQLRYNATR
jgi:hypothetical protein